VAGLDERDSFVVTGAVQAPFDGSFPDSKGSEVREYETNGAQRG